MGSATAYAELADKELDGQRLPTAIQWPPHNHHGCRVFMKVIAFPFIQRTVNSPWVVTCKNIFDSILPPELEAEWRSREEGDRRREKHTSPTFLAVEPKLQLRDNICSHYGPLAKPGQLSDSVNKALLKSSYISHLHTFCGCLQATTAGLSSCDRDRTAYKT